MLPVVLVPGTASATPLAPGPQPVTSNTDIVTAGLGGLYGAGGGTLTLSGVRAGTVTSAWLYWSGPTASSDPNVNATISFAGTAITGANIGVAAANCFGGSGIINSQAYRADVTALVSGDGAYAIANTTKDGLVARADGASLIVFFGDGNAGNDRRVYLYEGNDSNEPSTNEPAFTWDATLDGIEYSSGDAQLTLHVANGQAGDNDGTFELDGVTFASGTAFQGTSVPSATPTLGLWDIQSWDITPSLQAGTNTLALTHALVTDCLGLIVTTVSVVAPDETAPTLDVTITSGGVTYIPGTWANQPVIVTFSCTDEGELAAGIEPVTTTTLSTDGVDQQVASPPCEDAAGNVATPVTVTDIDIDQTAPAIAPIANQILDPTSPDGAPVFFDTVVSDNLTPTGQLVVSCVDQSAQSFVSGQTAPFGTTTITCTVTDLAGNAATTSFTVSVVSVGDLFDRLRAQINVTSTGTAQQRQMLLHVDIAEPLTDRAPQLSCLQLTRLDLYIRSQVSRRRITTGDANLLYAETQAIRMALGCDGTPR